jgi:hypothetical protein
MELERPYPAENKIGRRSYLLSLRVKREDVGRESEGVVVPLDEEDTKTSSKGRAPACG